MSADAIKIQDLDADSQGNPILPPGVTVDLGWFTLGDVHPKREDAGKTDFPKIHEGRKVKVVPIMKKKGKGGKGKPSY